MASLILQFEDRVLNEYMAGVMLTIGRLPDNAVILDNPAVSGHHACIFRDGDHFVVEDLQSTNGTFVNDTRVSRHTLQHGDTVRVGQHRLVFDEQTLDLADEPKETDSAIPSQSDTVLLDARAHRALLNRLMDAQAHANGMKGGGAESAAVRGKVGVLRVLSGRSQQPQYVLKSHTSLVGKGQGCLVRLQGWFKPAVAVAITRNPIGYVATVMNGRVRINSQRVRERYELKDGDTLEVSGVTLEFRLKDVGDVTDHGDISTSTSVSASGLAEAQQVSAS